MSFPQLKFMLVVFKLMLWYLNSGIFFQCISFVPSLVRLWSESFLWMKKKMLVWPERGLDVFSLSKDFRHHYSDIHVSMSERTLITVGSSRSGIVRVGLYDFTCQKNANHFLRQVTFWTLNFILWVSCHPELHENTASRPIFVARPVRVLKMTLPGRPKQWFALKVFYLYKPTLTIATPTCPFIETCMSE